MSAPSTRNHSIDLLRIFAAFGVITLHIQTSTKAAAQYQQFFWPLAVPFFFIASLAYFVKGLKPITASATVLQKIWRRIAVPFLCWSCIYFGLLLIRSMLMHQERSFSLWRIFIYGASSVQLYYLPALIALQLITLGIFLTRRRGGNDLRNGLLCLIPGLAFFIVGDIYDCFGVAASGQYFGILVYIVSAFLLAGKLSVLRPIPRLIAAGMVMFPVVEIFNLAGVNLFVGDYWLLFPFGGLSLMLLGTGYKLPGIPKMFSSISDNTYGIYLSHILFLEGFELAMKMSHIEVKYDLMTTILLVCVLFILSSVFTSLLRRIRLAKTLLLGEN